MLFQRLHDPGEVEEASGHPVHLVDHHAVDVPGLDVGHEALERRAFHVAARVAGVVVFVLNAGPPLPHWLAMYASPASRWASRLLNSCSRPSSVLFLV